MIKKIILIASLLVVLNPILAMAQPSGTPPPATPTATTPTGLPEYSGVDSSITDYLCTPTGDGKDLERCINRLYRFGITAGAIILVAMVVFAGYLYITSGETGKGKAKSMLMNSLVGMAMLLGSYALLYFINPSLVAFRAIQPPIFTAEDIPVCSALGLGDDCVTESDGVDGVGVGGTAPAGRATPCKGGIINTPSSIPHTAGASKLCKDLADKLSGLAAKTYGISWVLTSSISGTHTSGCHGSGNTNSGNCVDLGLNGGRLPSYDKNNGGSTNPKWGELCQAIISLGQVNFANEASNQSACQNIKPYKVEKYTSGPNLHINFIGN